MSWKKTAGEAAVDLVKSENVQNKTLELLGMLFPYLGIKKKVVDMYEEEIRNSDLSTEMKAYLLYNAKKTLKRLKNQKNIADIAKNNAKEGTDFSEKSGVDEEWFDRFMESASFVSSDEMQMVWGKILANEFEKPGCTPPNMTRILSEFTNTYAKAFRTLCSMRVLFVTLTKEDKVESANWINIIVYNKNKEYMENMGLSFDVMNELETLGVIKFGSLTGYVTTSLKNKKVLIYCDGNVIETNLLRRDDYPVGHVFFTKAGEALKNITEPYQLEGYEEVVKKYLISNSVSVAEKSSYKILLSGDNVQVLKENA